MAIVEGTGDRFLLKGYQIRNTLPDGCLLSLQALGSGATKAALDLMYSMLKSRTAGAPRGHGR